MTVDVVGEVYPAVPDGWRSPTPASISHRLVELSLMLDTAAADSDRYNEDFVQARQAYEVAYSEAILNSGQTSADRRKAEAVVTTADLKMRMEIASLLVRSVRTRLDTLERQIRLGQSLNAAARAEWAATGWTQP